MYESIVDVFDYIYPHKEYREKSSRIVSEVLDRVGYKPVIRVLDICCGTGRGLSLFNGLEKFELYGVDINPAFIKSAKRNVKNANFFLGDARYMGGCGFFNNMFDVIIISGVSIQHFSPSDRQLVYRGVFRYLSLGGIFFMDILSSGFVKNGIFVKTHILDKKKVVLFDRYTVEGRLFHRNILVGYADDFKILAFDEFEYYDLPLSAAKSEVKGLEFQGVVPTSYFNSTMLLFSKVSGPG